MIVFLCIFLRYVNADGTFREEEGQSDGVVRGRYSIIDNGAFRTISYSSDEKEQHEDEDSARSESIGHEKYVSTL